MNRFVKEFASRVRSELGFRVHEGEAKPASGVLGVTDFPYVVVTDGLGYEFSGNTRFGSSLADEPDKVESFLRVTYAGLADGSVRVLQSRTREALNRASLVVDGFAPARLKMTPLIASGIDDTVVLESHKVWFAVDEYRFITSKLA